TTRSSPATKTTTTTPLTNAQLKALIDQGVVDALAARDADRSQNGKDSHDSGMGVRRQALPACDALTWWNSHVKTVGPDVAYAMTWTNLKKKMTDKYCPRGEIKKLEVEMWNLKVKESDKIEKYVGGLRDMIHGSVMASKPKTMQDIIEFATEVMDKKISTLVERQAENKRKLDNNNQAQQQPSKKQGMAIAYTVGFRERKEYAGTLPLYNKFKFHHSGQGPHSYECGNQGHYRSDRPELNNQNYENQAESTKARGMVHAFGGGETNQDLNDMEDNINA
nr:hypothetical protein [Tanacetum cinerariifolium]